MRVGLVVPGFSADERDWCIPALRHLARALAAEDEVRVIALRYPYVRARYSLEGADAIALGGKLSHGPRTLGLWRDAISLLRAEHRRRPFDVLHAFWATESGFLAALAGRLLRVPTLVSLAGGELVGLREINYGDQRLPLERIKVAASLRLASAVSAGSRLLVSLAESLAHRRVHLAPLGVDTALFTSVNATREDHLVHVGSLTPVKDHATLLHAFAEVRHRGLEVSLELVGDGPRRGSLEHLAHALGLDGRVCFRGEVSHAELPAVYSGARAFVLSSRHEAQGMVALEAAACGLPLAGTRVGVMPELTCSTATVGDVSELASAIAEALGADLCGPATRRARAEYDLQRCTDRFRALYAALR